MCNMPDAYTDICKPCNHHNNPIQQMLLSSLFCKEKPEAQKRLSDWPKVTQPVTGLRFGHGQGRFLGTIL